MSGLSRLQKAILQAALDNRAYLHSDRFVEAENCRYTAGYDLLKMGLDIRQRDILHLANTTSKGAAKASVSRACNRLEARGLVVKKWYGCTGAAIRVTPTGEETVNNFPSVGKC